MEATHGRSHINAYDRVKQAARTETERPHALRQAIMSCRSGGVVSVIGVYGGFMDKFPSGAWMNRSLTLRTGQCHVHRYMRPAAQTHREGQSSTRTGSSPTRCRLSERAARVSSMFKNKQDNCEKVVLKPQTL